MAVPEVAEAVEAASGANIVDEENSEKRPQLNQVHLGSGVKCNKVAYEDAQNVSAPAKFVSIMSVGIWGYEHLSKRCVKQTKHVKDDRLEMSPVKVGILKSYFIKWLEKNGYRDNSRQHELQQLNVYLGRAITAAQKHINLPLNQRKRKISFTEGNEKNFSKVTILTD
ncbi:BEN domain-containing protein 5-like [Solenopsis invicta]|uniref:BEN domain-containing protein 5-like n=1 Tax=Solenopsis invicta TaxID=13686 RepID=UPI00193CD445|nr:BEN domain-containing protein 5-like [Solenopsis invicta]